MKTIHDILKAIGIEVPEDKKSEFDTAVNENYKTVAEAEKLRTARDNYKAQLETAQNTLKGFEGVDVNELNGKIRALQDDLTAQQTAHEQKIADMEFDAVISDAITTAGARSVKAVRAELDLDALKASKNQKEDIAAAITACKEKNDFLFGSNEPINNPIVGGSGNAPGAGSSALAAARAAFGLPAEKN